MSRVGPALVLAVLLVLSGCALSLPDDGRSSPTWTGDPDNPYREETLTVVVENGAGDDRDVTPMVRQALDYWEANAERYAGYPVEYEIRPDAASPDLRVVYTNSITDCGSEEHTAGCSPVIRGARQIDRPVSVRVQSGFSDRSTVEVLKHELGHTLGLRHGDEPREVMQAKSKLTTLPLTNATDRALPWDDPTLTYHVDYGSVPPSERDETRRQIEAALGYFADGAEGTVPENVSFERTDDRAAADVTIRFDDSAPCTQGSGSCGGLQGLDPDGDGAMERYTKLEITIVDLDTDAVGWHVGSWLARGFGLSADERPPPLRSDDPDDRRSEWWR